MNADKRPGRPKNATAKAQEIAVAIVSDALRTEGLDGYGTPDADNVAYGRMSCDVHGDAKGVARDSVEMVRYAKEHGFDLRIDPGTGLPVFLDNSISASKYGRSGRQLDDNQQRRLAYERVEALIRSAQVDVLLTPHLDRLHRQPKELQDLCDLIEDSRDVGRRVEISTLYSARYDLNDANDIARARIETAMAAQQSDRTHERIMRDNAAARAKGSWVGSTGPMGLRRTSEPPFLEPGEQAPIVRKAILDVIRGVSFTDIGREWTRLGVLPPRGEIRSWSPARVRNALNRPAIAGILTYQPPRTRRGEERPKETIGRGAWEPIISEAEWAQFQLVLQANGSKYGTARNRGAFTGLFRCSRCGHTLNRQKRDAQGTWAWSCLKNNKRAGFVDPCGKICILGPEAEAVVRRLLTEALQAERTVEQAFQQSDLQAQMDGLNDEIRRLDGELAQYRLERRQGKHTPEEYFDLHDPTAADKAGKEAELLALQQLAVRHTAARVNEEGLLSFVWDHETDDTRRQLLGFMFPYGIRVDPGYGHKNLEARLVVLEAPLTPEEEHDDG